MYSYEEIKSIVEGAFKPLRCVVDVHDDFKKKLSFKIFNENDKEITKPLTLIVGNYREQHSLKTLINNVRAQFEEKGFVLEPWGLN